MLRSTHTPKETLPSKAFASKGGSMLTEITSRRNEWTDDTTPPQSGKSTCQQYYTQVEVTQSVYLQEPKSQPEYDICVWTNDIAFSKTYYAVRRRFNDFKWLFETLRENHKGIRTPPNLPPSRLFGRFQKDFLQRRRAGLQNFLQEERMVIGSEKVGTSPLIISECIPFSSLGRWTRVHHFLGTELSVAEIDNLIKYGDSAYSVHSGKNAYGRRDARPMSGNQSYDRDSGYAPTSLSSSHSIGSSQLIDFDHDPAATAATRPKFISLPDSLDKVLPLRQPSAPACFFREEFDFPLKPHLEEPCDKTRDLGFLVDLNYDGDNESGLESCDDCEDKAEEMVSRQYLADLLVKLCDCERSIIVTSDTELISDHSEYELLDSVSLLRPSEKRLVQTERFRRPIRRKSMSARSKSNSMPNLSTSQQGAQTLSLTVDMEPLDCSSLLAGSSAVDHHTEEQQPEQTEPPTCNPQSIDGGGVEFRSAVRPSRASRLAYDILQSEYTLMENVKRYSIFVLVDMEGL